MCAHISAARKYHIIFIEHCRIAFCSILKLDLSWKALVLLRPLEAILVTFGRSFLIFFCLYRYWKNMKNDTTLVRMRSNDHLGDAKIHKRAPCFVKFNFFMNRTGRKRFSLNERRADLQNVASKFFIFAWGLSYDLSNFSDDFTPFFRL